MSGAAFVPGLHLIIALYFVFNNGNKNVEIIIIIIIIIITK